MKLKVATCQFPVEADSKKNLAYVLRQMKAAKNRGAHVAHFSEVCLSGYAGVDMESMQGFDWDLLQHAHRQVAERARELKMWVVVGSAHRLSGRHKPHNSLYIIDDGGRLVERYDKMFCVGDRSGKTNDLAHYSPGSHFSVFEIKGVRCGAQICHDFRYEELYREYKKRKVQVMFHSYHNGHQSPAQFRQACKVSVGQDRRWNLAANVHGIIVPPTMQAYAANNHMWISSNNTSARESSWPSFVVRPDGVITDHLQRNRAGILITAIDPKKRYYDAAEAWRDRAMRGIFHSGRMVHDARSRNRTSL